MEVLDTLIKEANKSTMYRKHAACILYRNKIVSIGHNYIPKNKLNDKKSIHAELSAIINLPKKYKHNKYKLHLFVIRIKNNHEEHELMLSKPCPECSKSIHETGNINKVVFSC